MAASAADRPRPGTAPGTRTASGTGTAPRPRGGAATQPPRSPGGGVPQRRGSPRRVPYSPRWQRPFRRCWGFWEL